MNHTDWFNLNRLGGANMAWGEDWASRGSWGYNGIEIVSFQGAWVECASRWGKMPSGFYAVLTQGAAHHKIFSLVSRNIDMIELYTYGPRYAGAEGSNFWSDNPAIYKELVIGTYALGPADTIIADGKQPDRKVAILYNRVHEIFNGGPYGMLCDRAISFTALGNGHYNPDLILVEDLNPERLARYSVLYINGFNLPSATVPVLRKWVENGGTLVGAAATGYLDEYNNPQPEMSEIFGAQQSYLASSEGRGWHPLGLKDHKPLTTLTLQETDLTPALETAVIGSIATLNPTTGKSIGTFEDGSCAAVINSLGKGKTLLYGFLPGILYKGDAEGSSTYHLEREPLITKPALATLGKPDFDIDAPQIEMALFEHESGMVITLNNFGYKRWQKDMAPATLSLKTDREISDVSTSFTGKLDWKREGDRIIVTVPVPNFVDCVILR